MSGQRPDKNALLVERSRPPFWAWGWYLVPAVALVLPMLFTGVIYWAVAGALVTGWALLVGVAVTRMATTHWLVTPAEIVIRPVPRFLRAVYDVPAERRIPLGDIGGIEVREGRSREIQQDVFGSDDAAARENAAGCEKFWAAGALIVRLSQPDQYGATIQLSTERPQYAYAVVTQAIDQR